MILKSDLQERISVDEIKTLARGTAQIADDQVNAPSLTTDSSVEAAWPDLSIGGERVCVCTDLEVQVLQVGKFLRRDFEQSGR